MIIYNVTCNVEKHMAENWLQWMRDEHLPDVMGTGCFKDYKILKLINQEEDDHGVNYAIQYTCESHEILNKYRTEHGPGLQAKTLAKFGDQVMAYRSVLEVIK